MAIKRRFTGIRAQTARVLRPRVGSGHQFKKPQAGTQLRDSLISVFFSVCTGLECGSQCCHGAAWSLAVCTGLWAKPGAGSCWKRGTLRPPLFVPHAAEALWWPTCVPKRTARKQNFYRETMKVCRRTVPQLFQPCVRR